MTETMANWYSFESTQRELPNEYQNDRVKMIFIFFLFFVLSTKVTSVAEGLKMRHSRRRFIKKPEMPNISCRFHYSANIKCNLGRFRECIGR